jgi:hypothetical protein
MEPKYQLIVRVGLIVRDAPLSQAGGGRELRRVKAGATLMCADIHNIGGVDYARLVSTNPAVTEWVRVAEADRNVVYVDVIPLGNSASTAVSAEAVIRLADAIEKMADALALLALSKKKE